MCCDDTSLLTLPQPVAEMLLQYRQLSARDTLWGEGPEHGNAKFLNQLRFVSMEQLAAPGFQMAQAEDPTAALPDLIDKALAFDPDALLREALSGTVPEGMVAIRVGEADWRLEYPAARPVPSGKAVDFFLFIDSSAPSALEVASGPHLEMVPARGARLVRLSWSEPAGCPLRLGDRAVDLRPAFRPVGWASLELIAPRCVRWSVTDGAGGAWFPDGVLPKWDFHRRPFFHACDAHLRVPSTDLEVRVTGGLDYETVLRRVTLQERESRRLELDPPRRRDPAAAGWYGGDMHVHMNYAGDQVCDPLTAARMQAGEGLHLMNLVAGNCTTSRIFDREALEAWIGHDLPWSDAGKVARMGLEYRNDLLGHFHALGPKAPPSRYQTGHQRSDDDEDWPANAVAAHELRALGATVGYCHPVMLPMDDDPSLVFDLEPRSVEAREAVVDVALGLVDSLDVLSNVSGPGSAVLYRKLLGAGMRLAVTAGTDCFLSFSRCATFSNPPGWARGYALLEGDLSVASYQRAVRAGRTMATNGPWLELEVDGFGPGSVIDAEPGSILTATARVAPPGARVLRLLTADGEAGRCELDEEGALTATVTVQSPTFIVAEASGPPHPEVLASEVYAHTSAVYVDVGGERVARDADVLWCLAWIDRLERLLHQHGRYQDPAHLVEVLATLERAREVYRGIAGAKRPG